MFDPFILFNCEGYVLSESFDICQVESLAAHLGGKVNHLRDELMKNCNNYTSRNGVNNVWILKNASSVLS